MNTLYNYPKPQVDAVLGDTVKFGIEIYGFPEPSTLTLERTDDEINLISSPRHSVEYTVGVAPFGVVNVTISDVVDADYTNYILTVDNGVGNGLIYTFYLNEGLLKCASLLSLSPPLYLLFLIHEVCQLPFTTTTTKTLSAVKAATDYYCY